MRCSRPCKEHVSRYLGSREVSGLLCGCRASLSRCGCCTGRAGRVALSCTGSSDDRTIGNATFDGCSYLNATSPPPPAPQPRWQQCAEPDKTHADRCSSLSVLSSSGQGGSTATGGASARVESCPGWSSSTHKDACFLRNRGSAQSCAEYCGQIGIAEGTPDAKLWTCAFAGDTMDEFKCALEGEEVDIFSSHLRGPLQARLSRALSQRPALSLHMLMRSQTQC